MFFLPLDILIMFIHHYLEVIEHLSDNYFEFIVRLLIYLYFFGISFWRFILFLRLGHVPLFVVVLFVCYCMCALLLCVRIYTF